MYAFYEFEGRFYVLIINWPFRCSVVAYSVWWNGYYCVDVGRFGNWKML